MTVGRPARRAPRAAVVVAIVGLSVGGWGGSAAYAVAPNLQGWWTQTTPGGLPTTPPQALGVPADGLLLQAGGSAPLAYAALAYSVASGQTATTLTLTTAPGETTPAGSAIDLCPLKSVSFSPEQGGSLANAPAYDCTKKVTATLNDDGVTFKAAVGALVSGDTLAVALVPSTSTFRVVLAKPSDGSLATTGGATSAQPVFTPDEPTPAQEPAPASAPAAAPAPLPGLDSSGNVTVAGAPAPFAAPAVAGAPAPVVVGAAPEVASQPANGDNAVPLASEANAASGSGSRRLLLLLLGGGLVAALWTRAGLHTERTVLAEGAEGDPSADQVP